MATKVKIFPALDSALLEEELNAFAEHHSILEMKPLYSSTVDEDGHPTLISNMSVVYEDEDDEEDD